MILYEDLKPCCQKCQYWDIACLVDNDYSFCGICLAYEEMLSEMMDDETCNLDY